MAEEEVACSVVQWTSVSNSTGYFPIPCYRHHAVAVEDSMIVFSHNNNEIVEELHVYDTTLNHWWRPTVSGQKPPGRAAYGIVVDGTRLIIFGGETDDRTYINDLHELEMSQWVWKKLDPLPPENGPVPCPRVGHSFTLVAGKVYLFGGLTNESTNSKIFFPRILNDLYVLHLKEQSVRWEFPVTHGPFPSPRESHTGVAYEDKLKRKAFLVVYGGSNSCQLGDMWFLNVNTMTWTKPKISGIPPAPRSHHTSTLIGNKMYVFGGQLPFTFSNELLTKCTNSLACVNLKSMAWENIDVRNTKENIPCARDGHSAGSIGNRVYIWSGRDRIQKFYDKQDCFEDLWYLEVNTPRTPPQISETDADVQFFTVESSDSPSNIYNTFQIQSNNNLPDIECDASILYQQTIFEFFSSRLQTVAPPIQLTSTIQLLQDIEECISLTEPVDALEQPMPFSMDTSNGGVSETSPNVLLAETKNNQQVTTSNSDTDTETLPCVSQIQPPMQLETTANRKPVTTSSKQRSGIQITVLMPFESAEPVSLLSGISVTFPSEATEIPMKNKNQPEPRIPTADNDNELSATASIKSDNISQQPNIATIQHPKHEVNEEETFNSSTTPYIIFRNLIVKTGFLYKKTNNQILPEQKNDEETDLSLCYNSSLELPKEQITHIKGFLDENGNDSDANENQNQGIALNDFTDQPTSQTLNPKTEDLENNGGKSQSIRN